jgi:hypothetical protein
MVHKKRIVKNSRKIPLARLIKSMKKVGIQISQLLSALKRRQKKDKMLENHKLLNLDQVFKKRK